jgi:hypothetical protein
VSEKMGMERIFIFYSLIMIGVMMVIYSIDALFGHRIYILLARLLRFKIDDVKQTQDKVDNILKRKVK